MDNWYSFQARERQQGFLREAEEHWMVNLAKVGEVAEVGATSERKSARLRDRVVAWLRNRRTISSKPLNS